MSKKTWNTADIPEQNGRVAIVTGSTSGIGLEAAKVLAEKGAKVVLAVRNISKGEGVAEQIKSGCPSADVSVSQLDLSDLSSVKSFCERFSSDFNQLDLLVNNAGVMMCPFSKTADQFEMQIGTNHLGHFALTGLLLPMLKSTADSRVVVLSSMGHKPGKIDLDDLNWEKRKYNANQAYFDSKLANLYFAYELSRRLESSGGNPKVTAAHPGWTGTDLQRHSGIMRFMNVFLAQGTEDGALPTLRAAVDSEASSGDYYGPSRFFEMHGSPIKVESSKESHDREVAQKLWTLSEELTGVAY